MAMPEALSQMLVTAPGLTHQYPVVCGEGLWVCNASTKAPNADVFKQALLNQNAISPQGKVLVVADETVSPLYHTPCVAAIQQAFPQLQCYSAIVPVGESAKDWVSLQALLQQAQQAGFTRADTFLALGGGVVSDLVGLAAALYYRGARFVALPTTVLAMVDASVGGKVAINSHAISSHVKTNPDEANSHRLKNAFGLFYPPHAVVMDTNALTTLPEAHVRAGLAEVLKTALLEETAFTACESVGRVSEQWQAFRSQHGSLWQVMLAFNNSRALPFHVMIPYSVAIKAGVVALDPHENGQGAYTLPDGSPRMWLNLGHTFAHGYEACLGDAEQSSAGILHGDAVALGLLDALAVSQQQQWMPSKTVQEAIALHKALGLNHALSPAQRAVVTPQAMLAAMAHDKKQHGSQRRLVVPTETIGQVGVVSSVSDDTLHTVLQQRCGSPEGDLHHE